MDSDNQFVAEEVNGGIRTIAQTVCLTFHLLPSVFLFEFAIYKSFLFCFEWKFLRLNISFISKTVWIWLDTLTYSKQLERIVFSQKILGTLLGAGLVRPCHVYHVDLDEIDEVDRLIDIFRPGKWPANFQQQHAPRTVDLSFCFSFLFFLFIVIFSS